MKTNRPPRITLLGSNSGRNAGDAGILAAIMKVLTETLGPDVEFEVPTTHPQFVEKHYSKMFRVRPINVMPWTGSIRLLGIPTMRSIRRTDLTFITDGIIFDVKLFNPLFNFLITLVVLVPWAKLMGKKVVCYSVGIGPLESFFGRLFAKWVGNASDLIMVRDEDSLRLFREIGVDKEILLTSDAVFANWGEGSARVEEILKEHRLEEDAEQNKLLGVNVTRYVDLWLKKNEKVSSRESFLPVLSRVLTSLKVEHDITPLVVTTQVMDADFGRELCRLVELGIKERTGKAWRPEIISNERYSNHEILALSARCRLYMGMRVHSLIIAAQSGTPVVGLVYAPKVRSFLKQLQTPEYAVELAEITEQGLTDQLIEAWQNSEQLKSKQQKVVAELQAQAKRAGELIGERFYPERAVSQVTTSARVVSN